MSRPWFRMYAEFASDPKVQLLSFDDQRHFIVLLCLKCNGVLDSGAPSAEFKERMIAKSLGLDAPTASEVKRRLVEVGLIGKDWNPQKWESRQYDFDVSTDRVRKFREKKRNETFQKRNETVSETDESREEQSRSEQREKRAARLPDDFSLTTERKLVAEAERLPAERTFAKFCDYWRSASGASARKRDWDAAWRNWCRTERDRGFRSAESPSAPMRRSQEFPS